MTKVFCMLLLCLPCRFRRAHIVAEAGIEVIVAFFFQLLHKSLPLNHTSILYSTINIKTWAFGLLIVIVRLESRIHGSGQDSSRHCGNLWSRSENTDNCSHNAEAQLRRLYIEVMLLGALLHSLQLLLMIVQERPHTLYFWREWTLHFCRIDSAWMISTWPELKSSFLPWNTCLAARNLGRILRCIVHDGWDVRNEVFGTILWEKPCGHAKPEKCLFYWPQRTS